MTIRRDLRRLNEAGRIRLVHGGVYATGRQQEVSAFDQRRQHHQAAKSAIGRAAAGLVAPQDSIAIDAGSTTLEVLEHLPENFGGTIVSHSLPVLFAAQLRQRFRAVGLGGDLLRESCAFVGPSSVEMASSLRVRIFFLGAAAIDSRGIYVAADIERPTKTALMDAADQVVLLADHSKFRSSAPVLLCKLNRLDTLVTDLPVLPAITKTLHQSGVKLVITGESEEKGFFL